MADTEALIASSRIEMVPLPILLDADVLQRNVGYCLRTGYTPRVMEAASRSHTLVTGVVVFATSTVQGEVERHLVEIAQRREVALDR